MPSRPSPHFIQLVWEATHKSFWRRQALNDFLRRSGVKESVLATWKSDESKRDFLNRLFPAFEKTESGVQALTRIASALAEQRVFPDLEGWEESAKMKEDAHRAVGALRLFMNKAKEDESDQRAQAETRKRAAEYREQQVRQQADLAKLGERLNALASQLGTREGGLAFQDWFYDLVEYFELQHRRPYHVEGREIDGSVTVGDTTYLVELKFTAGRCPAPDVESFRRKVETKADNTMGLMIGTSGFAGPAIDAAGGDKSPLLLLDHQHLYAVLGGALKLQELVNRIRRQASQMGRPFFDLSEL